jgi:hypothetical protein
VFEIKVIDLTPPLKALEYPIMKVHLNQEELGLNGAIELLFLLMIFEADEIIT